MLSSRKSRDAQLLQPLFLPAMLITFIHVEHTGMLIRAQLCSNVVLVLKYLQSESYTSFLSMA